MENTIQDTEILQRLQSLNATCEKIFATYLQEVAADAHSDRLIALKHELQKIRDKQFELFGELDLIHSGYIDKQNAG